MVLYLELAPTRAMDVAFSGCVSTVQSRGNDQLREWIQICFDANRAKLIFDMEFRKELKISHLSLRHPKTADVAKLVDAPDLGSGAVRRGGSIPFIRTKI